MNVIGERMTLGLGYSLIHLNDIQIQRFIVVYA